MPSRLLAVLLSLVVPPACGACRAPLPRSAADLCADCRARLPWLSGTCPRCALPAPCGRRCPGRRSAVERAWAPLAHAGPARDLVVALKHAGRLRAAGTMAAQIVANAPAGVLVPGAVLVPVPADPWRRRLRGVDHAALLAAEVGLRAGLPVAPCLARSRPAPRQAGRDRAARLGGPALPVVRGPVPERVVLVDDVHTTGATLDACARALRAAGAARVAAISYTRTLP